MIKGNFKKFIRPFIILIYIYFLTTNLYSNSINVGTLQNYPPLSEDNEYGIPEGFSIDLLNYILEVNGLDSNTISTSRFDLHTMLESGEIDISSISEKSLYNNENLDFTIPYITLRGVIITTDFSQIGSLENLENRVIGGVISDYSEFFIDNLDFPFEKKLYKGFLDALTSLSNGEIDAVIMQQRLALKLIEEQNITNLRVVPEILEGYKESYSFAVQNENRELLDTFNESLASMMLSGDYDRIKNKWFSANNTLRENDQLIIIGGDNNYPPYEFINENGEPDGFLVDLTNEIAKEMNLNIYFNLDTWNKTLNKLINGNIDIIQGVYYSEERDKFLTFSQPHSIVQHVIVKRKNEIKDIDKDNLDGLNIIVMRGDIMEDYLVENEINANKILADDYADAIEILSSGFGDCALLGKIPASYWIREKNVKNLVIEDDDILSPDYNYAVLDLNNKMIMPLNHGLSIIKSNGKYREIYSKWFGNLDSKRSIDQELLIKIILYGIIPIIIMSALVFVWFFILKKQVSKQTHHLKNSEQQLESVINGVSVFIFVIDNQGIILHYNTMNQKFINTDEFSLVGTNYKVLPFLRNIDLDEIFFNRSSQDDYYNLTLDQEILYKDSTNNDIWLKVNLKPISDNAFGKPVVVGTATDITTQVEQKEINFLLQKQLIHKNKMDALGQLAGGISHDFNNILSGIINSAQLLKMHSKYKDEKSKNYINMILSASSHAETLISKLLTFSSKKIEEEASVDIHQMLKDTELLLKETLDKSISLNFNLNATEYYVFGSLSSIHSTVLNMCINSKHAMLGGGKLTVSTENIILNKEECNRKDFTVDPGEYIQITISDNGIGMTTEVMNRIFEPFYTTKKAGKGTGLGLSAAYTTIKNHKGLIEVNSEYGYGTTFKLLFPIHFKEVEEVKDDIEDNSNEHTGLILFIDDEEINRILGNDILESIGYTVILAESGVDAIEIFKENKDRIDLVILDFMMPKMNGFETFKQLKNINKNIKVILSTGYTQHDSIDEMNEMGLDAVISKPFKMDQLITLVKKTIS